MTPVFLGYRRTMTDQKLTFAGTLRSKWTEIAEQWGWNEDTQEQYERDYKRHVLPYIPQNKALQDLTLEELENFLMKKQEFSEITVRHFKHLIKVVLQAGLSKEAYDELILGSALDFVVPENDVKKAKFYQVRKSLTIPQRMHLLKYFTAEPIALGGEDAGLFLMSMCGLRNNEACATDYEDLREIPESDRKCLWVYKSTAEKSSRIKASGKSANANRYLPVPPLVVRFLERRQAYLQEQIDSGTLKVGVRSAGKLPIVCHGKNYTSRCQADDLGRAAKKLFRNLPGFDMQILSILDEEAHSIDPEEQDQKDVEEKSPTAYLFRHDYATTLHCLGLTEAEIEYCIGHKMERTELTRNDFGSADILKEISEIIERHPANRLFFDTVPTLTVDEEIPSNHVEGESVDLRLCPGTYAFEASSKEPNESILIWADSDASLFGTTRYDGYEFEKTVDVTDEVFAAYRAEAEKQELMRPAWLDE